MPKRKSPIYSALENELDLLDEISVFVIDLAQFVDALQDAEAASDLRELGRLAALLAKQADHFGYPLLETAAQGIDIACKKGDRAAAKKALRELTEISLLIRRGHRGAA